MALCPPVSLYEPPVPASETPRVLVYVNGFSEDLSTTYDAMFQHFARKGFHVVFATYSGLDLAGAQARIEAIIRRVRDDLSLPPETRYAFAGHSLGTIFAMNAAIAADDPSEDLPKPAVVVFHDSAGKLANPQGAANAGDLDTDVLVIQAEDTVAHDNSYSEDIWANGAGTGHLRNYLVVPHDDRGNVPLVSDHNGVQSGPAQLGGDYPLDAIDWYGYFRPTEGAIAESFGAPFSGYSAYCQEAAPACASTRDMGTFVEAPEVNKIDNAGDLGI